MHRFTFVLFWTLRYRDSPGLKYSPWTCRPESKWLWLSKGFPDNIKSYKITWLDRHRLGCTQMTESVKNTVPRIWVKPCWCCLWPRALAIINIFHGSRLAKLAASTQYTETSGRCFIVIILIYIWKNKQTKTREEKKKKRKEHRMIQRALGLWSKESLVRSFWPRCRLESPNLWAEKLRQVLSPFLLCSGGQTRHIPYKEAGLGKATLDSICLSTWNYIHGSELWLIV